MQVIDIRSALEVFENDASLLSDVLNDLYHETDLMFAEIERGLSNREYNLIKSSSHKVKGSAANLYCEELKFLMASLLELSDRATRNSPSSEDVNQMRQLLSQGHAAVEKIKAIGRTINRK